METTMNTEKRDQTSTGDRTAGARPWLRRTLGYIALSALEPYRYRYLRTRMLHDALRRGDRGGQAK
jgi:hypothetical protein